MLQYIPADKETSVIYLNTCRMKIKISENLPSYSRKILHFTTRDPLSLNICSVVLKCRDPCPAELFSSLLLCLLFAWRRVCRCGAGPPCRSDAKCFPQYPDTMGFATKLDCCCCCCCCCCWWWGYFAKTSTLKIRYCKFLN